jgi:hypothetical protein
MTAVGTVTNNDPSSGNNTASVTPNLAYPNRAVTAGTVHNSHCTGTNLVSYFECLLFPSSISSHDVVFNIDNTISFTQPGYTGTWSQPSPFQLRFEYFDNGAKEAEFNGYATNGNTCFDGMVTFSPTSTYSSPYHVCF